MQNPESLSRQKPPAVTSPEVVSEIPTLAPDDESAYNQEAVDTGGIEYNPAASEGVNVPALEDTKEDEPATPAPRIEPTFQDLTADDEKAQAIGPTNRDPNHVIQGEKDVSIPPFTNDREAAEWRRRTNEATESDQQD